jgi:hypothetical protein
MKGKEKVLIEMVVFLLFFFIFVDFISQKIEQSFEKTPILHVVFGLSEIKDVDQSGFLVYFLKKTPMPIGKIEFLLFSFYKFQNHKF